MAEGPDPVAVETNEEGVCSICLCLYQEPKLLPCSHSFCKQCIIQLQGQNQLFYCPTCRSSTEIFEDYSNPEALALLKKLGLQQYYPRALDQKDALCIRQESIDLSLGKVHSTDHQVLPFLFLQKLMAFDPLCMTDLMDSMSIDEDDNKSESDCQSSDSSNSNSISGVHPVDCLLSLLLCSNDFLQQNLLSRLAKCQIAVPFIIPDPFTKELIIPLWGLRSIVKEWDSIKEKNEVATNLQPIISYKMPIISFIRLGKCQEHGSSKSSILNEVISDSHYDHFFHRNCSGGDYKLVLGEGLVDMCWYLSAGKTNDVFPDAITFLNLHGDARQYTKQMALLSKFSSMCFILVTEENLEIDDDVKINLEQFSFSKGGISLLNGIQSIPECLKKVKSNVIDLKGKNNARIKKTIRNHIIRQWPVAPQSIENYCEAITSNDHFCYARNQAAKIIELITSYPLYKSNQEKEDDKTNIKDTLLPLQGVSLWKAWAASDKEIHRQVHRGNKLIIKYSDDLKMEKAAIREKQFKHLESLPSVMEIFIASLIKLWGPANRNSRNYFLECLKRNLNDLSRGLLSDIQQQYKIARGKLTLLQENSEPDLESIEKLKADVETLQENITTSSFGLEHFLREVGQVYEAAIESPLYKKRFHCLPGMAAELLIDGYPLELMDGDAAHVPLQWVTAVLKQTVEMLDDPKVFVLSVLGLQSTGKSTMLNTTFGLQFDVSAGRCTRGAFMQLLPLDDELKTKTGCSYILVVDTEGLRAPQLDHQKTQKHDNELATFVIGLADMTLINIRGEVSGDMDDILQTSVHASLRMTQVKFKPSCQFIHQNVVANVSTEIGRARLTKKLDQFTIEAAKQENCEENFKCFNDVIKFNDQYDVHYFPGLWEGSPPMASISKEYSRSAQMLKLYITETLCKQIWTGNDLYLSTFQIKIHDLWKALLKEDFVFSFRNTQEITAYNSLEAEYCKWDWKLGEEMRKWEIEAENEINAVEANLASNLVKQKCKDLQLHISCLYEDIEKQLKIFFSESKLSAILVQWKAKFERRLKNNVDDLKLHAERHCYRLGKSKEAISRFEQIRKDCATIMTRKVQEYLVTIRQEQDYLCENLDNRILSSEQLIKLIERKQFSKENLKCFTEQGLITKDQEEGIDQIIEKYNELSIPEVYKLILFGGILTPEQVKNILIRERREEELTVMFDEIWEHLVAQLSLVPLDIVNVENEVEKSITDFARGQGYESQLIAKLQDEKKSLKQWGIKLELIPQENTHYKKKPLRNLQETGSALVSYLLQWGSTVKSTDDKHLIAALTVTERVFQKAKECLESIKRENTDFKPLFTQNILNEVDQTIMKESKAFKDKINFTLDYRLTVFLIICGHAIPMFEEMANSFMEQIDPLVYLKKKVKKPLLTKFKNLYYQIEAEKAVASTLCAHLEAPIIEQTKRTISAKLAQEMRSSEPHFSSKMALKIKILTDLFQEDDYESYMLYVRNVKECLQKQIRKYTVQYCDERTTKGTRLQLITKKRVSHFISVVESTVSRINETEIQEWLTSFSNNSTLVSEIGKCININNFLTGFDHDSLKELNVDNFKHQIWIGLQQLKKTLHTSYNHIKFDEVESSWKVKPHELLAESLIGCTEQCPFCGEQCDLRDPNHYTESNQEICHRIEIHRPSCLLGWRDTNTKVMEFNFCPLLVASDMTFHGKRNTNFHPYKRYADIYPEWSILPDSSADTCLYWKWFVAQYSKELAKTYKAKPPNVPEGWHNIEWPEIEQSLKDVYKVNPATTIGV